jgi:hypothetical protein
VINVLEQICAFIHNFFYGDRYAGTFTIADGILTVDGLIDGQYFRICGSRLNDGVYRYGVDQLTDETFTGVVWDMRPPKSFLTLAEEIEAWQTKYGEATQGPYQSESFGGYSYTLKNGGTRNGGQADADASTWRGVFRSRLNEWRKLR